VYTLIHGGRDLCACGQATAQHAPHNATPDLQQEAMPAPITAPASDDLPVQQPEPLRAIPPNPKAVQWARAMATYRAKLRRMSGGELAGQLAKWRRTQAKRGVARWLTERIQAVEVEIDRRDREPDTDKPETYVSGCVMEEERPIAAGAAAETPAPAVVEASPAPCRPPAGGSHGTDSRDARRPPGGDAAGTA
jgi:hypothetical protein